MDRARLGVHRAGQPDLVPDSLAVRSSGQRQAALGVGAVLLGEDAGDHGHGDTHHGRDEHDDRQQEAGPAPG